MCKDTPFYGIFFYYPLEFVKIPRENVPNKIRIIPFLPFHTLPFLRWVFFRIPRKSNFDLFCQIPNILSFSFYLCVNWMEQQFFSIRNVIERKLFSLIEFVGISLSRFSFSAWKKVPSSNAALLIYIGFCTIFCLPPWKLDLVPLQSKIHSFVK